MGLYYDSGYVNIEYIIGKHMAFNFIVGGRGTGKTYTALKTMREKGCKFIYMRRTQTQLDSVCTKELSPFKPLNLARGEIIEPAAMGKNAYKWVRMDLDENGEAVPAETVGYSFALSTISNLRGFSANDADYLIYDEFIPERHERPLKEECLAFLNAIETINRNRELEGRQPICVLCLANANDFANPLFVGLRLVRTVENMLEHEKTEYINPQRGIAVYMLTDSPISLQKANTALYRLKARDFSDMAIRNIFANFEDENIKSQSLKEYKPIFGIGELCFYRSKADVQKIYVCGHFSGTIPIYPPTREGVNNLRYKHKTVLSLILLGRCLYETHFDRALLEKYLTI